YHLCLVGCARCDAGAAALQPVHSRTGGDISGRNVSYDQPSSAGSVLGSRLQHSSGVQTAVFSGGSCLPHQSGSAPTEAIGFRCRAGRRQDRPVWASAGAPIPAFERIPFVAGRLHVLTAQLRAVQTAICAILLAWRLAGRSYRESAVVFRRNVKRSQRYMLLVFIRILRAASGRRLWLAVMLAVVFGLPWPAQTAHIASGSAGAARALWAVEMGAEIETFSAHESAVTSVAVSPSGRLIASGARDGSVQIGSVVGGFFRRLPGHTGSV